MDPMTMMLLGGGLMSGLGSFFGGRAQANAQEQAIARMMQRQQEIDSYTNPYLARDPNTGALNTPTSQWNSSLTGLFQQLTAGGMPESFDFEALAANPIMAQLIDPTRFEAGTSIPGWQGTAPMLDTGLASQFLDYNRLMSPDALGAGVGNTSTDALMQMLRGGTGINPGALGAIGESNVDPITGEVSSVARSNLEELAGTGGSFALTDMFGALDDVERSNRERTIAELQGSAGSLGQRFGTVLNEQEGRVRGEMEENANLRRQELARQSHEAAQGRRLDAASGLTAQDQILMQVLLGNQGNMVQQGLGNLSASVAARGQDAGLMGQEASSRLGAASTLANLEASLFGTRMSGNNAFNSIMAQLMGTEADAATRLAMSNQNAGLTEMLSRNQFGMDGARIAQGDNQLLAQILGQNAAAGTNANMFNESNRLNADQFNTNTAMSAFNTQQQAQQFRQGLLQQLITMGLGQENFADQRALQALGIRAGVPTAGPNTATGAGGNAIAGMGNAALMFGLLNRPTGSAPVAGGGGSGLPFGYSDLSQFFAPAPWQTFGNG